MFIPLNANNSTLVDFPKEIISKIFYEIDLRDLIVCSTVCKLWYNASLGSDYYMQFAKRVKYFACSNATDFTSNPKSLFIQHYMTLQALPLSEGRTRYQTLQFYLTPEGSCKLKEIYFQALPVLERGVFQPSTSFRAFPYKEKSGVLKACLLAGVLEFENPRECGLLDLACCHGDVETVLLVLKDMQSKIEASAMVPIYKNVIIAALEENQPCITQRLIQLGMISAELVTKTFHSNFDVNRIDITLFLEV